MYCYRCMCQINKDDFCLKCMCKNITVNKSHQLNPGTILDGKYVVGNPIGEGGFGITYIGMHQAINKKVAIKEFYPTGHAQRNNQISNQVTAISEKDISFFEKTKNSFIEEAKSLAKFDNEAGIVDVTDFFMENNTAYIVMEYLEGINLNEYIKEHGCFTADEIFRKMIPIMQSLERIHKCQIVHRDITPDNIMVLNDGSLKLMDFGSARSVSADSDNLSVVVKDGYAPEEQYRKNGYQGPWTDVYGMCATIYKVITGIVPAGSLERLHEESLVKPSLLGAKITEQLERVLIYGLEVHKENRCNDMSELLDLTNKALKGENDLGIKSYRVLDDSLKTEYAERSFITENVTEKIQPNYISPNQIYVQQNTNKVPKQNNKNLVPILVAVISVILAIIIAGIGFAYSKFKESDLSSKETTKAKETTKVTETSKAPETTTIAVETSAEPKTSVKESRIEFFSRSEATSTLVEQNRNYNISNLQYNNADCWSESVAGVGENEGFTLSAGVPIQIDGVQLINGYNGRYDQYVNNGKITKMRLEFSDGTSVILNLSVLDPSNMSAIQTFDFNRTITTSYIKATIITATHGEKFDDTCLSYFMPFSYE